MIMIRRRAKAWLGVSATHSATPRTSTMATNAPWAPDRRGVLAVTRELVPMRRHMHVPYRILVPRRGPRRLGGVAPARAPGCSPDTALAPSEWTRPPAWWTRHRPPNDRRGTQEHA